MRGLRSRSAACVLPIALGLAACQEPPAPQVAAAPPQAEAPRQERASYLSNRFLGRRMANGERLTANSMTAAHMTLPFGTILRVTNLQNGRSTVVRVADRGPHSRSLTLDLAPRGSHVLDMRRAGVVPVAIAPAGIEEFAEASDAPRAAPSAPRTRSRR